MFPGLKSMWPRVSGRPKLSRREHDSLSPTPREASSELESGPGDFFSCGAMKSAMRARKGSINFTTPEILKSLHFPSSSSLLLPMDAIWSSASSSATRSQVEQSELSLSAVPETSADNHPFHERWIPRIRGTWLGKSRARSEETAS